MPAFMISAKKNYLKKNDAENVRTNYQHHFKAVAPAQTQRHRDGVAMVTKEEFTSAASRRR